MAICRGPELFQGRQLREHGFPLRKQVGETGGGDQPIASATAALPNFLGQAVAGLELVADFGQSIYPRRHGRQLFGDLRTWSARRRRPNFPGACGFPRISVASSATRP